MSCHDYEGVMLVLCTPLQVKCYPSLFLCGQSSPVASHFFPFQMVYVIWGNGVSLIFPCLSWQKSQTIGSLQIILY